MPKVDQLVNNFAVYEDAVDYIGIAEVEFPDKETAEAFLPLDWFSQDVTNNPAYHNSNLSRRRF